MSSQSDTLTRIRGYIAQAAAAKAAGYNAYITIGHPGNPSISWAYEGGRTSVTGFSHTEGGAIFDLAMAASLPIFDFRGTAWDKAVEVSYRGPMLADLDAKADPGPDYGAISYAPLAAYAARLKAAGVAVYNC